MELSCFVFVSEFDNEYDGSTVIANSKEQAVKLISDRINYYESEWVVSEVSIPNEGIIIENSIPDLKD